MSICIAFIANAGKANAHAVQTQAMQIAQSKGFHCLVLEHLEPNLYHKDLSYIDLLVAIGGDGTILQAVPIATAYDIPILGINTGRVGFLSEISPSEFPEALDRIAHRELEIETHMMVACRVNGQVVCSALNEILIYKQSISGVAHIEVSLNGIDAGTISCDGLIISSPTGATGYSISAGGPVVAPGLDACVITPICPHSLAARPIVAAPDADIRVHMQNNGIIYADGRNIAEITPGDDVRITRSEKCAKFLNVKSGKNIYRLLRQKLV